MTRMPDASRDPAVPLADVEVAQHIAEAAREGGPADRTPTVGQLLAAFGADESDGQAAVARVQRALDLAGVGVSPPLDQAAPGSRVTLSPGRGPGATGARRLLPVALGGVALVAVIAGVALAAGVMGESDNGQGRASSLPAGSTGATTSTDQVATTPTVTTATGASEAAKAAEAERAAEDAKARAAAARRKREAKAAAERKAAAKRTAERKAAADRRLVVRLTPAEPSYACIVDGAGKLLFGGTLSQRRTLKAKAMRLNIGLSTVAVTVNGKPLRLSGSPSGYLLRVGKAPQSLPLGARPSC